MKKIRLIVLFLLISAIWCDAANRVSISVIYSSDIQPYKEAWIGFKSYLAEKNVDLWVSKYVLREQEPEIITEQLKDEKPEIIFTLGTKATKFAQQNFKNIPIVFSLVLDPEKVITPNITGVLMDIPAKIQLEQIKQIFTEKRKIGLVYSENSLGKYNEIVRVSNEMGISLFAKKISSEKELPEALQEMSWQIDFFMMLADTKIYFPESVKYLLLESLRQKFPVIGLSKFYTKAGAIVSFDCDYQDLGRQASEITLRILNGEKPSDIQPVPPRKINYSLNLTTAKRLGIKFSSPVIQQATEIYGESEK